MNETVKPRSISFWDEKFGGELFRADYSGFLPSIGDEIALSPSQRARLKQTWENSSGFEMFPDRKPKEWPFEYWRVISRTLDLETLELALAVEPVPVD
ncbi:hypothetical protein [Hyphobacterium sp.]|uniref:hypothetical protein n=1 Tax=Hyphobacterium sp. TaxID=2004662 RepID=UPI003B51D640